MFFKFYQGFLGESDRFSWVDEASRYSRGIMLRCYTVYD